MTARADATAGAGTGAEPTPWHGQTPDAVAAALGSAPEAGLDEAEAASRLARHGPNVLPERAGRGLWRVLLAQFRELMILVLLAAAGISALVGELRDAVVILVIVVLNALIGFVQEYRAERAMAALKQMSTPTARVCRGGRERAVDARDLVPGDRVLLAAGQVVPADLRLVDAEALAVNEAVLTGESAPVGKRVEALPHTRVPLGERHNMAYRGTVVTRGHGAGLVVATGAQSEFGRIAGLLSSATDTRTPLQRRLSAFSTRLAGAVLAVCAVIFLAGLLRGEDPVLMFLTAVSLAVAAIPEALPAVVSVSLALGAWRMVRQQALIRHLPSVETLGSITYICADKTGTLTENRMQVEAVELGPARMPGQSGDGPLPAPWPRLLQAMTLCADARRGAEDTWQGDPTEVALVRAAAARGMQPDTLAEQFPRVGEFAFDSDRKRMTTIHESDQGLIAFVKGAPEVLLPLAVRQAGPGGEVPLETGALAAQAEAMAGRGLRVLAFAWRPLDAAASAALKPDTVERELVLLGLVGLMDPPRPEAEQAVRECLQAGITPVMVTGDHPATARAVAGRLGLCDAEAGVMTGAELAALAPAELVQRVRHVRVYARVDPAQKIRIVRALQEAGQFAAMTGDGVNDAPALKQADIGVAMGRGGTDVAREASDMVLLDDNFATIVQAVRAGRRIYDNVRKFIKYTMTSNSGEIWAIFLAPFLGLPIPLLPVHILWINLVTDGLPGLALAAEPAERTLMRRPPRPPEESIFALGLWQHVLWVGLLMGAVTLLVQAWSWHGGLEHWRSMTFTVLTLSQLGHVLAVRGGTRSLFSQGLASNPWLLGAVLLTVGLQGAIVYLPALNVLFQTRPLPPADLALCLLASSVVFWAVELEKLLRRRAGRRRD